MAVAIRSTDGPEVPVPDLYARVVSEVNLADDPPDGLIFRWAGEIDGRFTVTELWETREDSERVAHGRLFPAIHKLTGHEPRQAGGPVISEHPVYDYTLGK
jgi:hypothetical protein